MMAQNVHWFSKATVVIPLALMAVLFTTLAGGVTHIVGNTIWSIPPANNLYTDWASNQTFHVGDYLYFEFDSKTYNVMQVGISEYRDCDLEAFVSRSFTDGPALVDLNFAEPYFFICTILDYCRLGLKVYVRVTR